MIGGTPCFVNGEVQLVLDFSDLLPITLLGSGDGEQGRIGNLYLVGCSHE